MVSHTQNFLQDHTVHEFLKTNPQLYEWNEEEFCAGPDYMKFRVMEFGVKSVPALIFFILGTFRLLRIKDIGVGNTMFSTHFKAKLGISLSMAVLDFIYIMIVLVLPAKVEHSSWIN